MTSPHAAAYLQNQYETVRCDATAGTTSGWHGQGCALLMSRGLPAWLDVVQRVMPHASAPPPCVERDACGAPGAALTGGRADLTRLLANLVLACAQEVAQR